EKFSTDWDKAWSSFKKQGKKSLFSQFNPNKYVSWNPRRSNYPLSEETDPIKRAERSNLMLWTSPKFTLAGAIVVVSLLLVYTILAPMK
ncbi:2,3-bisphosphoglycerate-independent phosphoglycerate mutase, partial [Thalictrum thalictroides]